MVRLDVPVDPDAPTARRWAVGELTDPVYHQRESLLTRLIDWLGGLFERVSQAPVDLHLALVATLAVLAVVLVVAYRVAGPVRLARRAAAARAVLDADDARTSAELTRSADDAAARGDWSGAVLDRFRAIVRDLEERTVLDERPGRTAHEVTLDAGARLPGVAADLAASGSLFDGVAYGDRPADTADDAWLRDVAARVRAGRPTRTDLTLDGAVR